MKKWIGLAMLALLAASRIAPALAVDEKDPVTIVEETMRHTLEVLDARRDEFTADSSGLQTLVRKDLLPLLDMQYSARLILGKAGRGTSPEELNAFAEAMGTVLVDRYAKGLLEFQSENQVEVLPLKGKNSDKLTRVRTRIRLENGSFTPVDYAFRKTDAGWKAFDVTVEGISYVITFRNQIAPRVLEDGIAKVTQDLIAGTLKIDD